MVEGTVERVTDTGMLARLARLWEDKLGWTFEVGDGVFLDTAAPGHSALVFAVTPWQVLTFRKGSYSPTRYTM